MSRSIALAQRRRVLADAAAGRKHPQIPVLVESLETRCLLSVATFAPAHSYNVGSLPSSIAVDDFNGDGFKDMAVANNGTGTVSILLGRGDGTFPRRADHAVAQGGGAESIAVGDFNRDGIVDLVVATGGVAVSVLSGRGDGTFRPSVEFSAGTSVTDVKVGDFNGDGRQDLAVIDTDRANFGRGSSVNILKGKRVGAFRAPVLYPVVNAPTSIAIGDFNADGRSDLAVTSNNAANQGNVNVLMGNLDGTFQTSVYYAVGGGPQGIAVGDFNGDGKSDLAVVNNQSYTISILQGRGDGTFRDHADFAVDNNPVSIATGDFSGDGHTDLVVARGFSDGLATVLLGRGNGTFQVGLDSRAGDFPTSVTVADFNSDGRADIAVPNTQTDQATVLLNNTARPSNIALSKTTVRENKPVGTVVGTFSAEDPNPSPALTYALVSGRGSTDNALFSISGDTLTTNAVFDFEAKQTYSIRVRVVDRIGVGNTKVFTISVLNANEAPTAIALSSTTVPQQQPAGTLVGRLSATDPEPGDTFTYTLVDGSGSRDNAAFAIMGVKLRTAAVFDFATQSVLKIRVRVTDQGGLSFERAIRIGVTQ